VGPGLRRGREEETRRNTKHGRRGPWKEAQLVSSALIVQATAWASALRCNVQCFAKGDAGLDAACRTGGVGVTMT
jgi:hypothetical protein